MAVILRTILLLVMNLLAHGPYVKVVLLYRTNHRETDLECLKLALLRRWRS